MCVPWRSNSCLVNVFTKSASCRQKNILNKSAARLLLFASVVKDTRNFPICRMHSRTFLLTNYPTIALNHVCSCTNSFSFPAAVTSVNLSLCQSLHLCRSLSELEFATLLQSKSVSYWKFGPNSKLQGYIYLLYQIVHFESHLILTKMKKHIFC